MIFDSVLENTNNEKIDLANVAESAYECGLEGAFMHVYENECNYNTIMKAVGLSEAKYYAKTGGDLLVESAEARSKFFDKIIGFFRSILEKIQGMYKKFVNFINEKVRSDANFVKSFKAKFSKDGGFVPFKMEVYSGCIGDEVGKVPAYDAINIPSELDPNKIVQATTINPSVDTKAVIVAARRKIANGVDTENNQALASELKYQMLGDKKEMEITKTVVDAALEVISVTGKTIKMLDKAHKEINNKINSYIKAVESAKKIAIRTSDSNSSEVASSNHAHAINNLNDVVSVMREYANIFTVAFGAHIEAVKTFNKQDKAICIKAWSTLKGATVKTKEVKESAGIFDFELV